MVGRTPEHPQVRLYCRADAAPPARRRQRTVRDRLATLVAEGAIAGVETETWPRAVPLSDGDALDPHVDAREAYATFEAWAERAGVSLAPSFDRRERYTVADHSDATRECLLPVVALAVRDGGRVVAAYPHTDGGDHWGVDEGLALLGSGGGPSVEAGEGELRQGVAD
jgi:hypothetical protein